MEAILGIKGHGFVMLASDTTLVVDEFMLQEKIYKLHRLTDFSMLAIVGKDTYPIEFKNYILRHLNAYEVANGYSLSPEGVEHFIRTNISSFKRRHRDQVAALIAGFDPDSGPQLHSITSEGTATPIEFGGHGKGGEYCETRLQELYKPDLKQESAYDVLKSCVAKIKMKYSENLDEFEVCVIDKNGIKRMESIVPQPASADQFVVPQTASVDQSKVPQPTNADQS